MRKKTIWLAFLIVATTQLWAQSNIFKVQGIPRPDLNKTALNTVDRALQTRSSRTDDPFDYTNFAFDQIQFWVGTGTNQAALVIDWYDENGTPSALVWGYRWHKDSIRTGFDMVRAIAKTDRRFLLLTHATNLGNTIGGIGFDLNGTNPPSLIFDNNPDKPFFPTLGVVNTTKYDYDSWTSSDPEDLWRAGWTSGYWSYQVKEEGDSDFGYSSLGASSRTLQNGSCDAWAYFDFNAGGMTGSLPRMPFIAVEPALRISKIVLNKQEITLAPSQREAIECNAIADEEIQPSIHWHSTSPDIASVDSSGQVTALSLGTTLVIATETDTQLKDTCTITVQNTQYTDGVFFLNEGWFGHDNGSINYLDNTGRWSYNVFQNENPDKQLGGTSQYGTIYGDKLYIVSKLGKDPGATITGSRLAVCDATTLECLAQFPEIGNSDGRSFVGVSPHKGYIATADGIYPFDIDNLSIGEKLQGTENSTGSLYSGQIGTMIHTHGKVFAVNQQKGLMIIDTNTDMMIQTIAAPKDGTKQRGFGSIVQSKDGNLWLSIATNTSGSGGGEDYLLKLNPQSLDTTRVALPKGASVPNSWYAWTADGFCSSTQHNKLYWKNNGGWFNSTQIFEYDIDQNTLRTVLDLANYESETKWGIYGAGFRVDPITDHLYVSLFKSFGEQSYKVIQVDPQQAAIVSEHPMKDHYWFPAMPLFPDRFAPVVSEQWEESYELAESDTISIFLGDKVSDLDNHDAAITKTVTIGRNPAPITATIVNDTLVVNTVEGIFGATDLTIHFNSNGRMATKTVQFVVNKPVDNEDVNRTSTTVFPTMTNGKITIRREKTKDPIQLINSAGQLLQTLQSDESEIQIDLSNRPSGIYLLRVGKEPFKVIKR